MLVLITGLADMMPSVYRRILLYLQQELALDNTEKFCPVTFCSCQLLLNSLSLKGYKNMYTQYAIFFMRF